MSAYSCTRCGNFAISGVDADGDDYWDSTQALIDDHEAECLEHSEKENTMTEPKAYGPPDPEWFTGTKPGWDSIDRETGDQFRDWALSFNTYTPELGDSRAMVDIVRGDRLTPEGIVPGVEAIQLAANYFDDQQRGSIHMTAAEARRVAHDLLAAADFFDK